MLFRRSIAIGLFLSLLLQLQTWALCATQNGERPEAVPCCASSCCPGDVNAPEQPTAPEEAGCALCDIKELLGEVLAGQPEDRLEERSSVIYVSDQHVPISSDFHAGWKFPASLDPPPLWTEAARSGVFLL